MENQVTVSEKNQDTASVQVFNLQEGDLPSLQNADVTPIDLMSDYWSPTEVGEQKRVFFVRIEESQVLSQESAELIDLECALFIEQTPKGEAKQIRNASRRLVGALQAHQVQTGTPLLITYMGKKRNRTNSFQSDSWSIKPLRVNI